MKSRLNKRFTKLTADTDEKIVCETIKEMLIEREDSIGKSWNKCLKDFSLSKNDKVDFDTFMKLFRACCKI